MATQQISNGRQNESTESFGELQVANRSNAGSGISKRMEAEINARYIMAERHPRVIENFRLALKGECERPGFAAKAEYQLPRGYEEDEKGNKKTGPDGKWVPKFIHGPSIRFVEVALRLFTNVFPRSMVIDDFEDQTVIEVSVTDLETNVTYSSEVAVSRRIERRGYQGKPPAGRNIVGERVNSSGDQLFLIEATDDEMLNRTNSLISKTLRTLALRILPGDIVDECVRKCAEVISKADAQDPQSAKRSLLDQFNALDVLPSELEQFLGHSVDRLSPVELKTLRGLWVALSNGETTWQKIMAEENPQGSAEAAAEAARRRVEELRKQQTKPEETKAAPTEEELRDKLMATATGEERLQEPDQTPARGPLRGRH